MADFSCPYCRQSNRAEAKYCAGCRRPVLAQRYLIGALVEARDGVNTYEALDTWHCSCGAWIENPADPACPTCQASPRPALVCQARRHASPPLPTDAETATWLYHEGERAWYSVLSPVQSVDWFPAGQRLAVGYAFHPGRLSKTNQDALLIQLTNCVYEDKLYNMGVFAIADGMGGHDDGSLASRTTLHSLSAGLFPLLALPAQAVAPTSPQIIDSLTQAVLAANAQVGEIHQQRQLDLGTTLTAAIVTKGRAIIANVGDSRTYLFRAGQLQQITEDHSKVRQLVQDQQIAPDDIYTHPERNVISRCLDGRPQLCVDTFDIPLEPDDRLLLCSDGVWEMVRDDGIARALRTIPDPQAACDALVEQANAAGGEDNISVIIAAILKQ